MNLSGDAIFQRALLELYESANLTAVPDRILEATQILVPGEVLAFTEVDYRTGRVGGRAWPEEYFKVGFATLQDSYDVLMRYYHQASCGDGLSGIRFQRG